MRTTGVFDPLYVAARRVLFDALDALNDQLSAIVLVGAQAVYVHAGEADLTIAPFTTDADLAIDPRRLQAQPLIEVALRAANFKPAATEVGTWEASLIIAGIPRIVAVDLLVPKSLGGGGRRSVRIPPHAKFSARKASGLEAALIDRSPRRIAALDPADDRVYSLAVAGPAALIVAKVHKMLDRRDDANRLSDKDALDIYRLLKAVPTEELVSRFRLLLRDDLSGPVTLHTVAELPSLFGSASSSGSLMAVRAIGSTEEGETVAASLAVLTEDLVSQLKGG